MSDERPDDTGEDLAPTKLSSFMRAALADQPLTGDTVKVSLPEGKVLRPERPLGPFRYAIVNGLTLECKDGRWFDRTGKEYTLCPKPPEKAAHRP